jgi:hypothetical protein
MTYETIRSAARAQDMGRPGVEVAGPRVRVWTAQFATQWLPDTPSHRHLTVVW